MTLAQALGYSKILIPNHILTFIADSLKTVPVSLDKRPLSSTVSMKKICISSGGGQHTEVPMTASGS